MMLGKEDMSWIAEQQVCDDQHQRGGEYCSESGFCFSSNSQTIFFFKGAGERL